MTITWLHLSDLHFAGKKHDYESEMVLKALLEDIKRYTLDEGLNIDFAFITGDVAREGKPVDYESAYWFFDELRKVTNIDKSRIFIVPGNHDVDWGKVTPGSKFICEALSKSEDIQKLFYTPGDRNLVFCGLNSYGDFTNNYFKGYMAFDKENFFYVKDFDIDDEKVAILGLNSAWSCLSDIKHRGSLLVGKAQVLKALEQSADADVRIALLHHSLDWLKDFDRKYVERILRRTCAFILHGHDHEAHIKTEFTVEGATAIIPCGACYMGSEYHNSYNYVTFDPASNNGTAHLRRYSVDLQEWVKNIEATGDKRDGRVHIDLSERKVSFMPVLTRQKYEEFLKAFKLRKHLKEKIKADTTEAKAEAYYKDRIKEMEKLVMESIDFSDTPLIHLFESFEDIAYKGALRRFKPLIEFIKSHRPDKRKRLTEKEIDQASLAFTRFIVDKYLKEQHRLNDFAESLTSKGKVTEAD